jgi:cobalt/nickel transport system permease protein
MTLRFSAPPAPESWLGRLDPRWRLAALASAALAAALLQTLPAALGALGGALVLACLARLPLRWYGARVAGLGAFVALFALPLPLLLEGGPTWQLGPLRLSAHGATAALLLSVKAITLLTLALIVLASGPLDATLKAARSLRAPGLFVQLGLLTYRYVFVLADELRRLRIALRVRGYRNRPTRHSYRTLGHLAGTLLVRGHDRAERVGHAMRCRGFDGRFRSLTTFRTTPADVLFFFVVAGGAAALCGWDWLMWGRALT